MAGLLAFSATYVVTFCLTAERRYLWQHRSGALTYSINHTAVTKLSIFRYNRHVNNKKENNKMREATIKLIDLAEDGVISWETIARAALSYMSEDEVADMAQCNGFIEEDEEEDD